MQPPSSPRHLDIGDLKVPFQVLATANRRMELRFDPIWPQLLVLTPSGNIDARARQFLQQKERWIAKNYHKVKRLYQQRQGFRSQLAAGKVLYQGTFIPYHLTASSANRTQITEAGLHIFYRKSHAARSEMDLLYSALRTLAGHYLKPRVAYFGQKTHSVYETIRIKDQKSKWGSCSSKRNLNFNWHAILLPTQLSDYLIIHELMHLREMNHSPRFWQEVAKYWPSYKQTEKDLSSFDWLIGIFEWLVEVEQAGKSPE